MAFKFALIAALCIAQGLAFKPLVKGPGFPGKGPCKKPISESAEAIPHEFEEAMEEMDKMSETVNMAAMEAYYKGTDPEVIVACFREQKGNYSRLGQRIAGMIRNATQEMAEILGDKYEKFATRAEAPLKTIAITLKSLPTKMWVHIKEKEFSKALEVLTESRKIVEDNAKILGKLVSEVAEEVPEAAKRAEELALEIRTTARNECKVIAQAFRKCVQEGGPQKPVEDVADDVEVEEDAEE